jgi:pilus assembly protein TadC
MEIVVALTDYALALSAMLGTLLVPFAVLYQRLRPKRRAIRILVQAAPEPTHRGKRR